MNLLRHGFPSALACMALASAMSLLGACGASSGLGAPFSEQIPATRSAATGIQLSMTAGQAVSLTTDTTLTLERINDSRCKVGQVCVWAGYLSYTFKLSTTSGISTFTLSEAMPGGASTRQVDQLLFSLPGSDPLAAPTARAATASDRVTVEVVQMPASASVPKVQRSP